MLAVLYTSFVVRLIDFSLQLVYVSWNSVLAEGAEGVSHGMN